MDYNTQRKKLALPEYGRNLQKMVDHIKTLETKEERNKAAKAVINVMGNMNPHLRDVADFKHKLWDHLFIMSDFELDVDAPYEIISKQKFVEKPESIEYNVNNIRYRHYGKILCDMVIRASEYEEGEEKELLIKVIANHMKKSYLLWNKDAVTDDIIFDDIYHISRGKITVDKNLKLVETRDIISRNNQSNNNNQKNKNRKHKKR